MGWKKFWRIVYALLFSVFPAIITYLQAYQKNLEINPFIIGLGISAIIFGLVMFIYYLHDKTIKAIHFNRIMTESGLEGIDQNEDKKSYTGKWGRVKDKLLNNPMFSEKDIKRIKDAYFDKD